ncbi:MAG TPA: hypothetical protein VGD45_30360 [Steroidobacter sp.]|uniref:hypothetical protein n=1 Tax=Steroidobacter sp. TaxID=1978227 RepID=UPI002EDB4865
MKLRLAVGIVLSVTLSGCGALQPMNPTEFRQVVGGSSLGTVETFEAARPYQQVVETLRKKSNECLAVATSSSGPVFQGNMTMTETTRSAYKPSLSVADGQTELAVQVDFGPHTTIGKKPEGGFYILVADAAPAGASATKVTIYRGSMGRAKEIGAAVRGWATGASLDCPNLSS